MEHLLDANHGSSGLEREQHKNCKLAGSPKVLKIMIVSIKGLSRRMNI
jgi:hypothetical protein